MTARRRDTSHPTLIVNDTAPLPPPNPHRHRFIPHMEHPPWTPHRSRRNTTPQLTADPRRANSTTILPSDDAPRAHRNPRYCHCCALELRGCDSFCHPRGKPRPWSPQRGHGVTGTSHFLDRSRSTTATSHRSLRTGTLAATAVGTAPTRQSLAQHLTPRANPSRLARTGAPPSRQNRAFVGRRHLRTHRLERWHRQPSTDTQRPCHRTRCP